MTYQFLLDHEADDEEESGQASPKKKTWRYRWPDEIRDDVLGRLLELNAARHRSQSQGVDTGASSKANVGGRRVKTTNVMPLLD